MYAASFLPACFIVLYATTELKIIANQNKYLFFMPFMALFLIPFYFSYLTYYILFRI